MPRGSKMLMTALAVVPLTVLLTSHAVAGPCSEPRLRSEMAASLRLAGEERPVHVSFQSQGEEVELPADLVQQYPDEITIILQYQFDNLVIKDDRLEVGLWFKGRYARVVVPFDAVTGFWDNAVKLC